MLLMIPPKELLTARYFSFRPSCVGVGFSSQTPQTKDLWPILLRHTLSSKLPLDMSGRKVRISVRLSTMMGKDQQNGQECVRHHVFADRLRRPPSQPVLSTCYGVDINIRLKGKKGWFERERKQNKELVKKYLLDKATLS